MKKLIGIAFIAILTVTIGQVLFAEEQISGFSASTVNPDTDFETYDILYVKKINMSEVKLDGSDLFYDYDDESGGMLEEDTAKEDLEYKYRQIFGKTLNEIIPVTYRKIDQKGKREMVLSLKIEGELKETRFLENLMPKENNREVKVAIEGWFFDQATGEELLYFNDEYISEKSVDDVSMFDEDDRESWDIAVNKWAKGLVRFLDQRRGAQYVFSK